MPSFDFRRNGSRRADSPSSSKLKEEEAEEERRLEPEAIFRSAVAVEVSKAVDRSGVGGRLREGKEERKLMVELKTEKQLLAIAAAITRSLRIKELGDDLFHRNVVGDGESVPENFLIL